MGSLIGDGGFKGRNNGVSGGSGKERKGEVKEEIGYLRER